MLKTFQAALKVYIRILRNMFVILFVTSLSVIWFVLEAVEKKAKSYIEEILA